MQVLAAANDALRAPREVGGTNDVTVSNRVNLVDPYNIDRPLAVYICGCAVVLLKRNKFAIFLAASPRIFHHEIR